VNDLTFKAPTYLSVILSSRNGYCLYWTKSMH